MQNGTTSTLEAQLTASDGAVGDVFGVSVAVSGGTAVVGADHRTVGSNADQGAAYVFVSTTSSSSTSSSGASASSGGGAGGAGGTSSTGGSPSGCGCSTPGADGTPGTWSSLGLGLLVLARRKPRSQDAGGGARPTAKHA